MKLEYKTRYLQIAFNYDISMVKHILPFITPASNIFIEAGTPFIKREGYWGIQAIRRLWNGHIIADMKVSDGAIDEIRMANQAGATGITALGSAPTETLKLFIDYCNKMNMISMIDMLGIDDPLDVLRPLVKAPDVVVLHRGRDEENTHGKLIQYQHVNRVHSKYNSLISAAGGVDSKEARSAIFNGANIVVVNLVAPGDQWTGIATDEDITELVKEFLGTIA